MSKEKSFEYYLKKLESVVTKLEGGECTIEDALELYESGVDSLKICLEKLKAAEQKIVEISPSLSDEKNKKESEVVF